MKKSKKLIAMLLTLMMLLSIFPVAAFADTVSLPDGAEWLVNEGDNHVWYKLEDGTLTIGGTGAMQDFNSASDSPWYNDRTTITAVVIKSGVTHIGNNAFNGCKNLASVDIPSSVTSIGDYAFNNCSGLASVTIPSSVTKIGTAAFSGCTNVTSLYIDSIESWFGVELANKASHPLNVGSNPKTLYVNGSPVTNLVIPNTVTAIPQYAFNKCNTLENVTIPSSVESIGTSAFSNCSGLASVTIPSSVTSIGGDAFINCSNLASVTIPSSVTKIGSAAFSGCNNVTSLYIDSIESWFGVELASTTSHPLNGVATGKTLFVNGSPVTNLVIPNTVTAIPQYAFYKCGFLTSVTIPSSVESIGTYAFSSCSNLASVTIPSSVTSIGTYAFYSCKGLASVTISSSVTSIGNMAFNGCSSLTSVTVKATNPPALGLANALPYNNAGLVIYVPYGTGETYKTTDQWKNTNIVGKITEAYMVDVASAANGTVTVSKDCFPTSTYAEANDTVTVTATQNEGYQLKSLVWNDGTKDYDIKEAKSFTMPLANVTVTAEFEVIPVHTHTAGNAHDAVAATCTEDGNVAYYDCTDPNCAYKRVGEDWVEAEKIVVSALGHDFSGDAVSNEDGTHSFKCVNDNCTAVGTGSGENAVENGTENCGDDNADHKCDVCDAVLTECKDENNDHYCDYEGCKAKISDCVDEDKDGICDICSATLDPLAQDREAAIAKLEAIVNGNTNEKVQSMLAGYVKQIENASSLYEINRIVSNATSALKNQIKIANEGCFVSMIRTVVNLCDYNHQRTTNKVMSIIKPILGIFGIR